MTVKTQATTTVSLVNKPKKLTVTSMNGMRFSQCRVHILSCSGMWRCVYC